MSSSNENKIEAVKGIMASLFALQRSLKALAPEYKWTGMGNLLGDFGEFISIEHYSLKKAPSGSNGFDAITSEGKTVQIKANHSSGTIGIRGKADLLLVIHVTPNGDWEEMYFGDHKEVIDACSFSKRDNKHVIGITKLKKMQNDKQN